MHAVNQDKLRNFCIIAHIDHGKSTLADRILEKTGAISVREKKDQFLDKMELERERGITIKAQTVRMAYQALDGQTYHFNLIDTPGHVDFSYEVSRSLKACEGALLVVDAAQGVQAQTVSNAYLAVDNDLEIIPVINKIDLPAARPDEVCREIEDVLGIPADLAILTSAKTGEGIDQLLEAIVKHLPAPKGDREAPLKALIFDSWFDNYLGAIALIRVMEGEIKQGMAVQFMATETSHEVFSLGVYQPHPQEVESLRAGDVGFVTASIKDIRAIRIGDTLTSVDNPADKAYPGFKEVKPLVFAGIYPTSSDQYEGLKAALEKLRLNDASFVYEAETSQALGFGFRCGFLGLLHMEIIRERLEREYDLTLVVTAPTVQYRLQTMNEEWKIIHNPASWPDAQEIIGMEEPYIRAQIHTPTDMVGGVIQLCSEQRGIQTGMSYPIPKRVCLEYELPFCEIMFDFYDRLKSISQGYASFEYEISDWRPARLVKLNILVNGDPVDALSVIIDKEKAPSRGRQLVEKLREEIPRQMYDVAIQAAIGGRIIARETVKALRKNVTAKCYGGDITRKRKLLEKQKEGKKRMKQVGNVEIPQEAFTAVLKVD
jgi:GTP-binding protein LepA